MIGFVRAAGASAPAAGSRLSRRQTNPPTGGVAGDRSSSQTSVCGPFASVPPYTTSFRNSLNAITAPVRGDGFEFGAVPAVGICVQEICVTAEDPTAVHGGVAGGPTLQTTEIVPFQR